MHDFDPHPLFFHGHLQTLGTRFFTPAGPPAKPLRVELGQGDALIAMVAYPPEWKSGDPIVVLVHGLTGSSQSAYMCRMAGLAHAKGVASVRVNLRNAGEGLGLSRRPYNSGKSDDIRCVLQTLAQLHPASRVALAGYSLGGNITLKLAGELDAFPVPNLAAAAAVNAPIDLSRCADALVEPQNKMYDWYFVNALVADAKKAGLLGPDMPRVVFPKAMTLRIFDDVFTAPRSGYAGAEDYYTRCSSGPLLPKVTLPTLLVTSQDDPFVPFACYRDASFSSAIETDFPARGGHCAYIGRDNRWGFRFWAEERLMRFLLPKLLNN